MSLGRAPIIVKMAQRHPPRLSPTRRRAAVTAVKQSPRLSVVTDAPTVVPYSQTLWGLMRTPFRQLVAQLEDGLGAARYDGIRRAHFRLLRAASGVEACSHNELAKQARITKQSAAYLVDHLEQHDYVESVADPRDDRVRMIRLTPRGRRVTREMHRLIQRTEN